MKMIFPINIAFSIIKRHSELDAKLNPHQLCSLARASDCASCQRRVSRKPTSNAGVVGHAHPAVLVERHGRHLSRTPADKQRHQAAEFENKPAQVPVLRINIMDRTQGTMSSFL
jgi:hypothetical protein